MNLHEFQAKQLLAQYGVPVPPGEVCDSAEAARKSRRESLRQGRIGRRHQGPNPRRRTRQGHVQERLPGRRQTLPNRRRGF